MSELVSQSSLELKETVVSNGCIQVQLAWRILDGLITERMRRCEELVTRKNELSSRICDLRQFIEQSRGTQEADETTRAIREQNLDGLKETCEDMKARRDGQKKEVDAKAKRREQLKSDYEAKSAERERQEANAAACVELEQGIEQCRNDVSDLAAQLGKLREETGMETLDLYSQLADGAGRMEDGRRAIERLKERLHEIWGKVRQDDVNA